MIVMSWNAKGICLPLTQKGIKKLLGEHNVRICGLMETKYGNHDVDQLVSRVAPGWKHFSNFDLDRRARILVLWDAQHFQLDVVDRSVQHIACVARCLTTDRVYGLCFVYGLHSIVDRRPLWASLDAVIQAHDLPWIVLGDFNCVMRDTERLHGAPVRHQETAGLIELCRSRGLSDAPCYGGGDYTWSMGGVWSKLDRVLINSVWLRDHRFISSEYLGMREESDHKPCIVKLCRESVARKGMFRFFNMWTMHPDFIEVVRAAWRTDARGFHQFRLARLLSGMKGPLRQLNRTEFSHISTRAADATRAYSDALDYYSLLPDDDVDRGHIESLRKRASWLNQAEHSFLSQQAKAKYVLESDRCTRYFHSRMRANCRRNHVASILRVDGTRTTSSDEVAAEFVGFYQGMLGVAVPTETPDVSGIASGPSISADQGYMLTSPVEISEIKAALWAIGDEKSPGPDGFGARFFKASWDVTGAELCLAVREFFTSGTLLKQLNHTIIAPIPKVDSPTAVSQFRPISCCNVVYKVISKVMAIRLSTCLGSIIDEAQNAFVEGRQMTDNIFLLQELLRRYLIKKETRKCCLNIDIAKAYDTVSWDFLRFVLTHLGFPGQFIAWVMECVTTVSYSVRVNRDIHGHFQGKRGLRQGDPLSALLFVLCVEILSRMIRADTASLDFNFHQFCASTRLTHLVFADDIVLFCRGDVGSVQILMGCLRRYGTYSGLCVNRGKSAVFLGSVPDGSDGGVDEASQIIAATGFSVGSFPFRYLGVPVSPHELLERDYAPMFTRISVYLSEWAKKNLSFAGRKELISSVIQGVEGFWLSVLPIPPGVIRKLIRLCRNFLWKSPRVRWSQLCASRDEGGIGMRDLIVWNRCFMLKHLWHIIEKRDCLWIRWVHHRYMGMRQERPAVDALTWEVHSRDSPLIKGILRARDHMVMMDRGGLSVEQLLESWCSGGKFSVAAAYDALRPRRLEVPWSREVWPTHGTPKHCFLLWIATLQRLPTYDRLHYLDVDPVCRFCACQGETHDHLFFLCPGTKLIWSEICQSFRMPAALTSIDLALSWLRTHARGSSCLNRARVYSLSATVYYIWHARNARIFEGNEIPTASLIRLITIHVYRLLYARFPAATVLAM